MPLGPPNPKDFPGIPKSGINWLAAIWQQIKVTPTVGMPTIAYGTGAPLTTTFNGAAGASPGTPAAGSLYRDMAGAAGARVFWFYAGAWIAQSSP